MYECYQLADSWYYLKSRSSVVRLVSCLPKSNKGIKDDFLIVSGEWHNGLHCSVRDEKPVGYTRFILFFFFFLKKNMGINFAISLLFFFF